MDQKKLTNIDVCYTKGEEPRDDIRVVYTENATNEIAERCFVSGLIIGSLSVIVLKFAVTGFQAIYGDKLIAKKVNKKSKKNSK